MIQGPCVFTGNNEGGYTFLTVGDSHIRTLDAPIVERLPEMEFVANFIPLNRGTSFFSFGIDIAINRLSASIKEKVSLTEVNIEVSIKKYGLDDIEKLIENIV